MLRINQFLNRTFDNFFKVHLLSSGSLLLFLYGMY
jgi:hypothetical protein